MRYSLLYLASKDFESLHDVLMIDEGFKRFPKPDFT